MFNFFFFFFGFFWIFSQKLPAKRNIIQKGYVKHLQERKSRSSSIMFNHLFIYFYDVFENLMQSNRTSLQQLFLTEIIIFFLLFVQVLIPLKKISRADPSENANRPTQKYIHIVTVDNFEFWFMGFVNYQKSFKYLTKVISQSSVYYPQWSDFKKEPVPFPFFWCPYVNWQKPHKLPSLVSNLVYLII